MEDKLRSVAQAALGSKARIFFITQRKTPTLPVVTRARHRIITRTRVPSEAMLRYPFIATSALALAACSPSVESASKTPTAPEQSAAGAPGTIHEAFETRMKVVGSQLFLLGTFDGDTGDQVRSTLEAHPEITTLVFTVNGGSIDDDATLALGREIRTRGLATHLLADGVIASGGVSLFLSGASRTIERGAKIGVHSWEHCWGDDSGQQQCKQAQDHARDDPGHALHGDYTEQMLGSRDFYWFAIAAAPSNSIHWLTDAEIEAHALATMPLSSDATDSPFGDDFDQERRQVYGEPDEGS